MVDKESTSLTKRSRGARKSKTALKADPTLAEIAFKRFQPDKVIKALLENRRPYEGYRRLIFAAFCAWVILCLMRRRRTTTCQKRCGQYGICKSFMTCRFLHL